MFDDVGLLHTVTLFDFPNECLEKDVLETHHCYRQSIRNTLKKVLPAKFFEPILERGEVRHFKIEKMKRELHAILPFFHTFGLPNTQDIPASIPFTVSFYLISIYRANAFKFFFDMICCWLMPGKRLNAVLVYAVDFVMPAVSHDTYTLCEVMIQIESQAEYDAVLQNLAIIESEVRLGVSSKYYARRILEVKGLSSDEKLAFIQETITHLMKRFPDYFDSDLLTEMQHTMIVCSDEFKRKRGSRHLSRIIAIHYLYKNGLKNALRDIPERRHLFLKIFHAKLTSEEKEKPVLGILITINFLREKEILEEKHLLKAIQEFIPEATAVPGSYFSQRTGSEKICAIYLEICKPHNEKFSKDEVQKLRRELSGATRDRVEYLLPQVVMPPNEEEVLRNMLSLANQIKYVRDIPQVVISFDKQTPSNLFFTVIIARVLKSSTLPSLQQLFRVSHSFLEYIPDRCKVIGHVRKKYAKEATVFKVKFSKEEFLRGDHSLDIYKARQMVVSELTRILGEIRDFNGGMIAKQNELLDSVRTLLAEAGKYNELLLENFFYSLSPVVMRSFIEADALKSLFIMLLEALEEGFLPERNYYFKACSNKNCLLIMITFEDTVLKDEISKTISKLNYSDLASTLINVCDVPCLGYIYQAQDLAKREHLLNTLQLALEQAYRKNIMPEYVT